MKPIEKILISSMIIIGFFMLILIAIKVLAISTDVSHISESFDPSDYDSVIINN